MKVMTSYSHEKLRDLILYKVISVCSKEHVPAD